LQPLRLSFVPAPLLAKYRMAPAVFAELQNQSNPNGYSVPGDTVVVAGELITLLRNGSGNPSGSGGLVLRYALQGRN
jgi:hypothetical protein